MNQVRLVADSSCDLLTLSGMDFVSVPLTIRTETEEFRDDATLDVDEMVRALRDTNGRSYSACPNVADWEGAFGGCGDVIAFTITSGLSGSYGVACAAKESCEERDPSRRIQVFDSLSAGPEIALLIEKAAAELRAGTNFANQLQREFQDFEIALVGYIQLPGQRRVPFAEVERQTPGEEIFEVGVYEKREPVLCRAE